MIRYTIIFITVFMSLNVYPKIVLLSDKFPKEFKILVSSLKDTKKLQNSIDLIDSQIQKIDESHWKFIIRSEIYQNIMNYKGHTFDEDILIKNDMVVKIARYSFFYKNQFSALSLFILNAIKLDILNIVESGYFDVTIPVSSSSAHFKKVKRKMKIIQPWINRIIYMSPENFEEMIQLISHNIFMKITDRLTLFTKYASAITSGIRYKNKYIKYEEDIIIKSESEMSEIELSNLEKEKAIKATDMIRIEEKDKMEAAPKKQWKPKE